MFFSAYRSKVVAMKLFCFVLPCVSTWGVCVGRGALFLIICFVVAIVVVISI